MLAEPQRVDSASNLQFFTYNCACHTQNHLQHRGVQLVRDTVSMRSLCSLQFIVPLAQDQWCPKKCSPNSTSLQSKALLTRPIPVQRALRFLCVHLHVENELRKTRNPRKNKRSLFAQYDSKVPAKQCLQPVRSLVMLRLVKMSAGA